MLLCCQLTLFFSIARPGVALIIRKQMDDARFSVADGFMVVFPMFFTRAKTLNWYDRTNTSVNWKAFTDTLCDVYMDHHSMPNINTPRVPLTQSESIFSSASQEVLSIRLSEEAEAFDSTDSPLMAKGSLSKHDVVGDIDHKFYLAGETKDDFLKRQLRFFVPALVWAYNYLKCSNLQIEADIVLKKSELEMQEWLANRRQGPAPPAPQFPNVMHRFIHGTALERRRSEAEEVDRRRELEEIVHSFNGASSSAFDLNSMEFDGLFKEQIELGMSDDRSNASDDDSSSLSSTPTRRDVDERGQGGRDLKSPPPSQVGQRSSPVLSPPSQGKMVNGRQINPSSSPMSDNGSRPSSPKSRATHPVSFPASLKRGAEFASIDNEEDTSTKARSKARRVSHSSGSSSKQLLQF